MYILEKNYEEEINIKNSRFITLIFKIKTINDVMEKLENTKEKYPKATHYPYAYIINDVKKSSDDKEPSGTAGIPILSILEHEKLNNILVIVVRYFGGIKLGTGGLVRGYTKVLKTILKKAKYIEQVDGKKISFEIDYQNQKQTDYLLKDIVVESKEFKEKIIYTILISNDKLYLLNNLNYKIIDDIKIEKRG